MTGRGTDARSAAPWRGFVGGALVVLLASCGGERRAPVFVEIVGFAADDAVPRDGWRLRDEAGANLDLRATDRAADHRGFVLAADAPEGRYGLFGPEPWGLVGGPVLVAMQPGTSTPLGVGKRFTIYLVPPDGARVGEVRIRDRTNATDATEHLPFERADGADGRAAIRVPPEKWGRPVEVRATIVPGGFAKPELLRLKDDGEVNGASLRPAPTVAVRVSVLPAATATLVATATEEGVSIRLSAALDARGTTVIESFPQTAGDLALAFDGEPGAPSVPTWRLAGPDAIRGELRLARAPAPGAPFASVVVRVPGAPTIVQARSAGAASYGVVAEGELDTELDETLRLVPGRSRLILSHGDRVAVVEPFDAAAGDVVPVSISWVAVCRVQATVEGGAPKGRRYTFECLRVEGDEAVGAHGWIDRYVGRDDLELALPPGDYRLRLVDGPRVAPWTDLRLGLAGTRASVRLPPPR